MSRTKKPRNKKYNPRKASYKTLRHQASKCYMYTWESTGNLTGEFNGNGPYPEAKALEILYWAMHRPEKWHAVVIACFITGGDEYYEEMQVIPPEAPVTLAKEAAAFDARIETYKQEAIASGNPKHLIDVLTVLRLETDSLTINIENEERLIAEARDRAKLMFQKRHEEQVARLEALCEEVA